jgi:hypothetical protein
MVEEPKGADTQGPRESRRALARAGSLRRDRPAAPLPIRAPALSPEARAARKPRPPADLLVGLQDSVHRGEGALLSVTPIRARCQ